MAEEEKRKVEDDLAQKEAELEEAEYVLLMLTYLFFKGMHQVDAGSLA